MQSNQSDNDTVASDSVSPLQITTTPATEQMKDPAHQPLPQPPKKRPWKRVVSSILLVAFISIAFWQRQNVIDWWALRNYTPTVDAAQLATQSTMSDLGRRIFYLQKPQVQDKVAFYKSCEEGETAIVLGCYKPNFGIYLLRVTDDRLEGVEQVTAAHEMLHAAYGRLSYTEQKRVNALITKAYSAISDTEIRDKITQYQTSGADTTNELHSILGTEVANLPTDLEQYYKKYFTNREKVVNYATAYKGEFLRRKAKVQDLDAQLTTLESQIISSNQQLSAEQSAIQAESKRLDAVLRAGDIDAYNQGVATYNQRLVPFRNRIAQTKQLVAQYRQILDERNTLAREAQELEKALDSRIQTPQENI